MRAVITLLAMVGLGSIGLAQSDSARKRIIEIVQADALEGIDTDSASIRKLLGNVILKNEDVLLHCDSAYHFFESNYLDAFGNVLIEKGDTVRLTGDTLRYFGDKRTAVIVGREVVLTDNRMRLTTDELFYDLQNNFGRYADGGELINEGTTLTSKRGYYHARTKDAFFRDSVVLSTDDYTLTADTLQYNSESQTTFFHGLTEIVSEENIITCLAGWYNTENETALFKEEVRLINPPQVITADSIYYDRTLGTGKTYSNVRMVDTSENTIIICNYGEYNEIKNEMMATQQPVLISVAEGDSIFISADTLRSATDTNDVRKFNAYHGVLLFKSNLQGVCDSLAYSDVDSLLRLYQAPLLWSDSSQFSADTIHIRLVDNRISQVSLYREALIGSITDTLIYNQIKGLAIHGYFGEDTLRKMLVEGNGESIYFAQDENEAYIGLNRASCSRMWIYLKDDKVDRITFIGSPEATMTPMRDVDLGAYVLDGFKWQAELKPGKAAVLGD